jgi:hypothetical protein
MKEYYMDRNLKFESSEFFRQLRIAVSNLV